MTDSFGRKITYMRISVTDLCNLRCRYCMPAEGVVKKNHDDIMSEDEIINAIEAASELGISKIRFTGGEPLVKKNIVSICRRTSEIHGIKEICITTNGILLPNFADSLRLAGVERVNISLDTLRPERYSYITRGGSLNDAVKGIESAIRTGFRVKINSVIIGGFNDDEISGLAGLTMNDDIDIRFIELMPMTETVTAGNFVASRKILDVLPDIEPLESDGVAEMYRLKNARGRIGFISPVSDSFCQKCNRIRLTADGYLKPCLHSAAEIFIRHKSREEMKNLIADAIISKPERHKLNENYHTDSLRTMNRIGG